MSPGEWFAVGGVFAIAGGLLLMIRRSAWRVLAGHYPAGEAGPAAAPLFRRADLIVRVRGPRSETSENLLVTAAATPAGLRLWANAPLLGPLNRLFFPELLVPWADVSVHRREVRVPILGPTTNWVVVFRGVPGVEIVCPDPEARALAATLPHVPA
jgi:hypothetical protein